MSKNAENMIYWSKLIMTHKHEPMQDYSLMYIMSLVSALG